VKGSDIGMSAPRGGRGNTHYLPTLDGWRAIAIVFVLLAHSPTLRYGRISTLQFHFIGEFGVEVFFAISGILICSRLLSEEASKGSISLKRFYIRRIFRIQPPALLYLLVIVGLTAAKLLPAYWQGLVGSLLLVRNYVGMQPGIPIEQVWATAHFWSLSVEEHFYLILPTLLIVTTSRWRAPLLGLLGGASFVWRMYCAYSGGSLTFAEEVASGTTLCFLFLPAAAAVLLRNQQNQALVKRWLRPFWVLPVLFVFLPVHSPVHLLRGLWALPVVLCTLYHPESVTGRLLELAPLKFIGRISYSLYLWQEVFLSGHFAPKARPFGALHQSLWVWPCIFACAVASYYLVEKPFIAIGHRLTTAKGDDRSLLR
jgi:peptidoglycan/LPS O-acetylase OafA/YrhL